MGSRASRSNWSRRRVVEAGPGSVRHVVADLTKILSNSVKFQGQYPEIPSFSPARDPNIFVTFSTRVSTASTPGPSATLNLWYCSESSKYRESSLSVTQRTGSYVTYRSPKSRNALATGRNLSNRATWGVIFQIRQLCLFWKSIRH